MQKVIVECGLNLKTNTLPQVTSDIVTFSRMVRFSCVLPLWKASGLTITPDLIILKNLKNGHFIANLEKRDFFLHPL